MGSEAEQRKDQVLFPLICQVLACDRHVSDERVTEPKLKLLLSDGVSRSFVASVNDDLASVIPFISLFLYLVFVCWFVCVNACQFNALGGGTEPLWNGQRD